MSKELTRYGTDIAGELGEWPDGEYVRYSDYAELESELTEIKERLSRIERFPELDSAMASAEIMVGISNGDLKRAVAGLDAHKTYTDRLRRRLEDAESAITAQEPVAKMNCDDVAEILLSIGWDSPNDAQWTRLKDALPDLFAAIRGEEGK